MMQMTKSKVVDQATILKVSPRQSVPRLLPQGLLPSMLRGRCARRSRTRKRRLRKGVAEQVICLLRAAQWLQERVPESKGVAGPGVQGQVSQV